MAVAETASAQGKSAAGESVSTPASTAQAVEQGGAGFRLTVVTSLMLLGGFIAMPLNAQIVADRNAQGNQRPTVLTTASGIPQVNIQTPSAAGVSRNTYSQFDVGSKGVILNNSRTDVNTQIGGYVQGNAWLATGGARVILNEVNSNAASKLNGYVEVAGQRAEVIIANPAGIAVNGGGFINASSVTLTTGTPVMNAGSLDSFKVRGGAVTIDGTGLDTSTTDYTNILTRAAQVNAGIWAKDLKVVTGANDISAGNASNPSVTTTSTGIAPTSTPAYALDVAQLGGMYAGKIFLIGTEAGVGVRNAGVIGATASDVVLTNNGLLTNSGSIYASGNTSITTQGSVANTGKGLIAAQGNTSVIAQGAGGQISSEAGATLAAGMNSSGVVGTTGNLNVTASNGTSLNGKAASGADTSINASTLDISGASLTAQNATLTASTQGINASGSNIAVRDTLTAQTPTTLTTDGATVNAAQINITAHDLSNVGGKLQQSGTGDMAIVLPGTLDNTSGTIATNAQNLTLGASTLTNTGANISHAGTGTLGVNVGTLGDSGGTILSNGAFKLQASGAVDMQKATTSAQQVTIQAASLGNQGGRIVQASSTLPGANITSTRALDNTGGFIGSNSGLQINAGSVNNANAQMIALQSLAISSSGVVNNTMGLMQSNGALSVQAASLDNTSATLSSAQGSITISTSAQTNNTAGKITAATDINLSSASLLNASAGLIGTNGVNSTFKINSDNIQNTNGKIIGAGNVSINGAAGTLGAASPATLLDNTAGLVQSGATLSINASQITNAATYTVPSDTSNALGLVGNDVQLSANSLNNQGGEVLAGNNLTIQAAQSIDNSTHNNQGGLLYAGKALQVQDSATVATLISNPNSNTPVVRTLQVTNTGGTLNAGATNQIKVAGISGDGKLLSQGDLSLDISGDFSNTGTVNANGNTTLTGGGTVNNSGTLASGQTLTVAATSLNNAASGVLSGVAGTKVILSDTLTNRGLIDSGNSAGTSLTLIKAQTVNNLGTGRIYGDNIAIGANTLINDAETVAGVTKSAVVASRNTLDIGSQTLNNQNGSTLLSLGNMVVGGSLDANNRATGTANSVTNSASTIQSVNGSVSINTTTLQNLNPTFSYSVVDGTPSAQKTQYTTPQGKTIMDDAVVMLIHQPGQSSQGDYFGSPAPANRILTNSSQWATAAYVAAYKTTDFASFSQDCDVQGHCTTVATSVQAPANSSLWTTFNIAPPAASAPSGSRPSTYLYDADGNPVLDNKGNQVLNPDATNWDKAAQPYVALQTALTTLRSNIDADMQYVQKYSTYTETVQQAVVSGGTPGTISSAGNLTINASSSARNDNSRILAGGALTVNVPGSKLDNTSTNVTVQNVQVGSVTNWISWVSPGSSDTYSNYSGRALNQTIPTTVQVSNSQALQYTSIAAPSTQADTAKGGGGVVNTSLAAQTNGPTLAASTAQSTNPANRIASTSQSFKLPNSSLYQINNSPTAHYLVQTDPAFTNRLTWLSSDYISSQIALDPNVTQKRLGDGFYEQQLIREQVAQLTGQRFLGNYRDDQQEYQALMDSGLTFAKTYNLRPGIVLTAAQVASLTTDIVWLQQETVTLADGSTTQALVPHVYAAIRDGDLASSGALLAGNSVSINTAGDVNNSGTIAGRKLVQISGNNVNNTVGSISGQNVTLSAVQDINNVGGSINADNNLLLSAGRDINVTSTTQQSSGSAGDYQFSQSGIDRVATLYTRGTGTLLASAGNNINLTAAQVSSGGDVQVSAGNSINLTTLQKTQSDKIDAREGDTHLRSSSSEDVGTSIKSAGNTTLAAGNTLVATAANVAAQGDLTVNAQNIALLAGQTTSERVNTSTATSSGFLTSGSTSLSIASSSATAQVNSLSGNNVTVTANQDLVSVGSKFAANDTLTVEGENSQTFYAAKDVSTSSYSKESSSSFAGISLGNSSTSDTSAKAVSVASELQSTNAINVKVGNSATLEGANLRSKSITFQKTDPSKAGQLNLNGSVDTTQTTHTEKSETLGVYQSTSGSGSTTQTLNLTKLNGKVTVDDTLNVAVQLPKVVNTSGDKPNTDAPSNAKSNINQAGVQAQIDQLVQQPGLEYLGQLGSKVATANPTQWSQVQLAHDNWSYSQQGLTPAGAALLSIAVAAYTGGMGAEMLGGTAGTATTAATLGGSTMLGAAANAGFASLAAQASVAMVNNGGDIGKTLQQLGSDQSIKNLLTTMVTAGALDALGNSTMFNGQSGAAAAGPNSISTAQTAASFGDKLLKNITNNVAGSAIDAAINGKPFDEKTLTSALTSALITTGMAQGAKSIGDAKDQGDLNSLTQAIAHAALGCVAGSATAGNASGCSAGAVGGVVGELAANYALKNGASREDATAFAKVLSATAGLIAGGGGDNVAAVNIAATTGANAAANNRGLHQTESEKLAALKQGKTQLQQDRLDAAACALVHCAEGVPDSDPKKSKLLAMQTAGASYTAELQSLKNTGEFIYATLDPVRDRITKSNEVLQRTGGAVNLVAGSLGTVGGGVIAAGGAVGCPATMVSCAAVPLGAGIAGLSYNQAQEGSKALFGSYTSTEGQRVLDSFNPSTYPGDRDPLTNGAIEAAKLGAMALMGKYIPKGLAAVEGLEVAPATKVVTNTTVAAEEASTAKIACTNGTACFVAGTMVQTASGLKAIETFQGGELVYSRHERTQEFGFRPVIATKQTHDQALFEVVIQNAQGETEMLHTTAEHPFWVTNAQGGAQWLKASLLQTGAQLIDRDGNTLTVQSQTALNETATVYNIQVAEHSTYHVGQLGAWVHNANCCDVGSFKGANGGTATRVATGELAGTADQVFPGVSKGTYNPSGSVLGQATGDSCAAGCTRMAAVPDVPEFYIRDAIGTQANQGTNLANIPSGLKDLGYKGNASYTASATVDTVAQQTASGNAVIVNVKTPGGDVHAIVVDSISNGTAYIRDPLPMPGAVGSGGSAYSIPASALKNQMTGKAVYITPPSH